MTRRAPFAAVLVLAAGALCAEARAEEVVLASGVRYEATEVQIVGENVRFTYLVGSGRATVTLPMARLQPRSLFLIVLARTPRDPKSQLALGWFALERGLLPDAAYRFKKAAEGDPSLASERDRGLASIERKELEAILASAEADLRRGRFETGLAKVAEVRRRAGDGTDLARRADGLLDLAKKVEERDGQRIADEATKKAEVLVAAQTAALDAALARADKAILSAIERRNRVAKPGISSSRVQSDLEASETLLREGRRLLASALDVAGPRRAEVEGRDAEALRLLVATHLDLSDVHRTQRRFPKARDHVRAALVLDPANARGVEAQRLIEEAARPAPEALDYPYPAPYSGYGYGSGYRVLYPWMPPTYSDPYPYSGRRSTFGWRSTGWRFFSGW